ncbi:MAG: serine hydrolase [Planctomycetota bacterium]
MRARVLVPSLFPILTALGDAAFAQRQPAPFASLRVEDLAPLASAYAAKIAASALFVSRRPLASVLEEELAPDGPIERVIRPLLRFEVDEEEHSVTCRILGHEATARWVPGLGCALGITRQEALRRGRAMPRPKSPLPREEAWPDGEGDPDPSGIDAEALRAALDLAFAERGGEAIRTRAVVIVKDGRLVAERYAKGYDRDMPLPGWSMSKTITLALIGCRILDGRMREGAIDLPEWRREGDPRAAITLDDLLRMRSGLSWREDYEDPTSPALTMLFRARDAGSVAAAQPLAHPPRSTYLYSSGTTNLLCRLLRESFDRIEDYWSYPRGLFDAIGARSMVVETDPSGTFVGSSFAFATARDWARFGQFLLQDGVWDGRRLLPEGWMAKAQRPTPGSRGGFGRHLWLDAPRAKGDPSSREWPELPEGLFHLDGHEGQYVFAIPKARLVVVRLGCTKRGRFPLREFLDAVWRACR